MEINNNPIPKPVKPDVRIQKAKGGKMKRIKIKRQVTMNEKVKDKKMEPNKRLSFVSMQNSSFNLSFKDHNFESQNAKEEVKNTITNSSCVSSKWIKVLEKKKSCFGNINNVFTKLTPQLRKVSYHN